MEPDWYYSEDDSGDYFVVFADANNASSKRRFNAGTASFVDEEKGGAGSNFAIAFRPVIKASDRLGALSKRPNLQDAVRKGRLPDDVFAELRRLKKSIVG